MLKAQLLPGLHTFEVAGRLGSFTRAASALHVTTGAVSQQIKHLEQMLEIVLFERHSRGVRLTAEGEVLLLAVQKSLQALSETLARLQQASDISGNIRLKLTPSFAYKWLVPRLHSFYQRYPNIRVQVFAEGALVHTDDHDYDIAIDYGQMPYAGDGLLLLQESLIPVMSQDYLQAYDWQSPDMHWQDVVLLHDAMPWQGAPQDIEWRYWFDQHQLSRISSARGHYFNRTDMAMEAAAAGVGVAMARGALVEDAFANKSLVSPFSTIDAGTGYFVLQDRDSPAVNCFKEWLLKQSI